MKVYTPKQWHSMFDCPSLIIDDQGLIWEADEHSKMLFGSPSGKVDYAAGKIYGKGLGYDLLEEPIATLTKKNDVTEVRDAKQGEFSAPILYIKGDKIYTPEEYTSIGDMPGAYIRREDPAPAPGGSSVQSGTGTSSGTASGKGSSSGLGSNALKFGGILLAFYCVVVGVGNAMPIWLSLLVAAALLGGLIYLGWFSKKKENRRKFQIAFWAVLAWFVFAGSIILSYYI